MNEKHTAECVLNAIYGLENAMMDMTSALLGNAEECPPECLWWDEILGDTDEVLCKLEAVLHRQYHIDPMHEMLNRVLCQRMSLK